MVQTAEGLPLSHEVFEGNVSEASTLLPMLNRVCERYPIERVVVVADRGLLNLDNLEALESVRLPSGKPLEYILAVPTTRYGDFEATIRPLQESQANQTESAADWQGETLWQGRRLVIDHCEDMARYQRESRQQQLDDLQAQADVLFSKLQDQEEGKTARGRKLSEAGATAKLYQAIKESRMGHLMEVDLESGDFGYLLKARRQRALELLDGKLVLVTNVSDAVPEEIVSRYKALADIERGFRVLKSELEIGPMYHRLPDRIRAHAQICFLALVLHRVMRFRLKAAGSEVSPERSLEELSRIQRHHIKINGKVMTGLTTLAAEQLELLKNLKVAKPVSE